MLTERLKDVFDWVRGHEPSAEILAESGLKHWELDNSPGNGTGAICVLVERGLERLLGDEQRARKITRHQFGKGPG